MGQDVSEEQFVSGHSGITRCPSGEGQSKDWRVYVLGEGIKYFLFLKHK